MILWDFDTWHQRQTFSILFFFVFSAHNPSVDDKPIDLIIAENVILIQWMRGLCVVSQVLKNVGSVLHHLIIIIYDGVKQLVNRLVVPENFSWTARLAKERSENPQAFAFFRRKFIVMPIDKL